MEAEVNALAKIMESPPRPFVAVVGGAKVADKVGVLSALLGKVDALCIGGAMAYTFLKAKGVGVGLSLARKILEAHYSVLLVESSPGQGTTFRFSMRLCRGADQ